MELSMIRARLAAAGAATALLTGGVLIGLTPIVAEATTSRVVFGPAGTEDFGSETLVLANGNYAVVDSLFDGVAVDEGAVFLYNGATNTLISTVTGSTLNDRVGSGGLVEVGSGFVIVSPLWNNGGVADAGAVTFVNGTAGLNAAVGVGNSLVGSSPGDQVGTDGAGTTVVTRLTNGNYVVGSASWDNGVTPNAGAATWGNGGGGTIGTISAVNSLIGGANDFVSEDGITPLDNGNYVVASSSWNNGVPNSGVGAVTWSLGTSAVNSTRGLVSNTNSLIGTTANDNVGFTDGTSSAVTALVGGAFAVASPNWNNTVGPIVDAGAVTFGSATGTPTGAITSVNSLVGATADDQLGLPGSFGAPAVTPLSTGKYVVTSPNWDNPVGPVVDAGAATLISPAGATASPVGNILVGNSLIGTSDLDQVGDGGATALVGPAGNYVVISPKWDNTKGAVTRGSGAGSGVTGAVSAANSLVGTTTADFVGSDGVTALNVANPVTTNGNYVVASSSWSGGLGAATRVNGVTGAPVGAVSDANSLVGSVTSDFVGSDGVTALTNGNYVVDSANWTNAGTTSAGAVTWSGAAGIVGAVTTANSLVGTHNNDNVGVDGVTALTDGNYVVDSGLWNNGATAQVGAVTWGNGAGGTVGGVTAANSLVGSTANDFVGETSVTTGVTALDAGDYVVVSSTWDNGGVVDAGAATYNPVGGLTGPITADSSVFGTPPGLVLSASSKATSDSSIVVSTSQNRVLLLRIGGQSPTITAHAPVIVSAAPGATSAVVTYTNPTGTQKTAGSPSIVCSPASGSVFPLGVTAVGCTATDAAGFTASTSFNVTVNGTALPSDFVSLSPGRLADTRPGGATVDNLFAGQGIRSAGSTLELTVRGRGGVSADAGAVELNVTAVDAVADGFVTVFPCGATQPNASNLNFTAGSTVPNAVIAKVGTADSVCIFVSQTTHLVVDVGGFFPAASALVSLNPSRVLDTRDGQTTIDNLQQGGGPVAGGSETQVQITNRASVPANASAVVLNVTITEAGAPGFATIYPCGVERPNASNINYGTGTTVANMVVSKIGADGKVCIFTQSNSQLIADVNGYFPATSTYQPLVPARLFDTRTVGGATVDGQFQGAGLLPANTTSQVNVTNRGGVPVGAATVVLNVTVTEAQAPGFLTVYPCGIERPNASNLNFVAGGTVANAVMVKVGASGQVCFFNSAGTQVIADVNGYLAS